MTDQLMIGDKASFDDFEASLASRKIGMPKKKSIKETVPFSNVTYDFSKINGELYWEERELEFVFEIIASTPEELEELKTAFSSWVMNVHNDEIHDPFIPDYHFIGTYDDMDFADEESLDKTTVTVKLMAYPYKIANLPTVYEYTVAGGGYGSLFVENKSSHPVQASISFTTEDRNPMTVKVGDNAAVHVSDYSTVLLATLPQGVTEIYLDAGSGDVPVTVKVSFTEEVF